MSENEVELTSEEQAKIVAAYWNTTRDHIHVERVVSNIVAARLADAEARAEAALLQHQRVPADSPFNREGRDVCGTCMDGIHPADWPCQTVYALRGDQ